MADKPIIFSAPTIRALLDGRKTQTRRIIKRTDLMEWDGVEMRPIPIGYATGNRLWVRESHYLTDDGNEAYAVYSADAADVASHLTEMDDIKRRYPQNDWSSHLRLRPPIHMPRWASRLTLIVTDVRVQRLQEISEADALAEGVDAVTMDDVPRQATMSRRSDFASLWNSIHGAEAWAANPWVVALTFTVHKCNIDSMEAAA